MTLMNLFPLNTLFINTLVFFFGLIRLIREIRGRELLVISL